MMMKHRDANEGSGTKTGPMIISSPVVGKQMTTEPSNYTTQGSTPAKMMSQLHSAAKPRVGASFASDQYRKDVPKLEEITDSSDE